MVENYVCLSLIANGYQCFYWQSARGEEVDFIIQQEGCIIPIEVKSADNTRAENLAEYIKTYRPDYAIKVSTKNSGFEDGRKSFHFMLHFVLDYSQ